MGHTSTNTKKVLPILYCPCFLFHINNTAWKYIVCIPTWRLSDWQSTSLNAARECSYRLQLLVGFTTCTPTGALHPDRHTWGTMAYPMALLIRQFSSATYSLFYRLFTIIVNQILLILHLLCYWYCIWNIWYWYCIKYCLVVLMMFVIITSRVDSGQDRK